jgi:hypothetical protein
MATSGTVGVTALDIAKIIEKTYRRCGIPTGAITPEMIEVAKENLFLLFNNWSNRGINLWAVDRPFLGLNTNVQEYIMPTGTIDVLNALHRNLTHATPTTTTVTSTTQIDYVFDTALQLPMYGIKPSADYTGVSFTWAGSADGITFVTQDTQTLQNLTAGTNYWYESPINGSYQYWRLSITSVHTNTAMSVSLISGFTDLVMSRLNRDDYMALPNKTFEGTPSLQYFFNRQMLPTMTLWPVPSVETHCLALVIHRQIQDVGDSLTATIEVPDRWLDAFSWNHAAMCAVETPAVAQDRINLVQQQSVQSLMNAESEERDSAPIYITPNITVYTR